MKKISLLGLILMAASAITAAAVPGKSSNFQHVNSADNGTMRSQSGVGNDLNQGVVSCVADNDQVFECHVTVPSLTNANGSNGFGDITAGNTSDSTQGTGHEGDTTSNHND